MPAEDDVKVPSTASPQDVWRPTGSMSQRLTRLVVLVATPALLIVIVSLLWHVIVDDRAMLASRAYAAIEVNRSITVSALDGSLRYDAAVAAERIAKIAGAKTVRFRNNDGKLIATVAGSADISRQIDPLVPGWQQAIFSFLPDIPAPDLMVTRNLEMNGDPVGSVEVVLAPPPILNTLFAPLVRTLLLMLPAAIFIIFVAARMRRQIVDPIDHLLETMDHVAHEQNYSLKATPGGPNEVGSLIISFNQMIEHIHIRNLRLAEHRLKLQELVIERTRSFEEAARQAEKASHAKGDFLARMSHEIRTPMNGVVGMAELLKNTGLEEQQQHMVQTMRTSADALLEIINDILDFSKIEAGQLQALSTTFSPVEILEEVCELLAPQAHDRNLELVCDIDAAVPQKCLGDPLRLRQILVNLLGNAVKYTERGHVIVRATATKPVNSKVELRVEVEDTGLGVPEGQIETIFEAFTQGDDFATRKHGGTGLGLAITRQLATLLGGNVGATSKLGVGSTFWLTLPLAVPDEAQRATDEFKLDVNSVLVVQEDESAIKAITKLLESGGTRVWAARSGRRALESMSVDKFSVIMIDELLPDMSGAELIDRIRSVQDFAAVPIILMTSSKPAAVTSALVNKSSSAPDARLRKPLRRGRLRSAIDYALGRGNPADDQLHEEAKQGPLELRVLLVDDSEVNREVAIGMLEALGCTVDSAHDGSVGVEQALSWSFDLVLMDCHMPLMDGFEATRRIRAGEASAGREPMPIIALTANSLQGDRERCLEAGMTDFISKPFTMKKLGDVLRAATKSSSNNATPAVEGAAAVRGKKGQSETGSKLPVVDMAHIEELRSLGRPEIVERAKSLFQKQAEKGLVEVDAALQAGSAAEVERASHALKSAALSIGGRRFAAVAGACEQAARKGDLETARRLARRLQPEFTSLCQGLAELTADGVQAA